LPTPPFWLAIACILFILNGLKLLGLTTN